MQPCIWKCDCLLSVFWQNYVEFVSLLLCLFACWAYYESALFVRNPLLSKCSFEIFSLFFSDISLECGVAIWNLKSSLNPDSSISQCSRSCHDDGDTVCLLFSCSSGPTPVLVKMNAERDFSEEKKSHITKHKHKDRRTWKVWKVHSLTKLISIQPTKVHSSFVFLLFKKPWIILLFS